MGDVAKPLSKAGRYQIIDEIGRGSMGVVYSGYDPVIGRKVAIKTMQTDSLRTSEFSEYKARFQREAQSAGVLAHPNIVTVYDFGEDHGVLYLTMEYLEGRPLDKVIEDQPQMPVEKVIRIYEQVCSALNYAHSQKIVHRDVKPANIMMLENGQIKVTDFGIAKIMGGAMTQTGGILGTPNYMSPEQVTGKQLDGRSDIFSLGVILYELATGQKPFCGDNITTVIYKIVNEKPTPPRQLLSSIHPGMAQIIDKALSKDPEDRYQNCLELAEDLKHYRNLRADQPFATVPINMPQSNRAEPPAARSPQAPRRSAVHDVPLTPQPKVEQPAPPVVSAASKPKTSNVFWLLLGILITTAAGAGAYYYFAVFPRRAAAIQATLPAVSRPKVQVAKPVSASPAPPSAASSSSAGTGKESAQSSASSSPAAGTASATESASARKEVSKPPTSKSAAEPAAAAAPVLASLTVETNTPGATISLDGKSNSEWVSPHTFSNLKAGAHHVTVAKDGLEGSSETVDLKAGASRTVHMKLIAATGAIDLRTDPAGIDVRIDGTDYGKSPAEATLPAGSHHFALFEHGHRIYRGSFALKPNGFLRRTIALNAGESDAVAEIRTIPPGANVSVDGRTLQDLTPLHISLHPGPHVLILWEPGYQQVLKEIRAEAGKRVNVNVMFHH